MQSSLFFIQINPYLIDPICFIIILDEETTKSQY